ncbi:MAG: polysaccharide lyase 6 family protein [Verrucomicrobiae bacterium]|nr:polysaccharide lyase 6 family protein [Verrucomicrobiae bacterium]
MTSQVVFLSIGIAAAAAAADLTVGTPAQLMAVLKQAQPGDVIVMADGVWRDVDIVFVARGTAERPITLRAQTPGKVIVTGGSRLRMGGEHLVVDGLWFRDGSLTAGSVIEFRADSKKLATHCRLTNCAVTGYNPRNRKTDYKWCSVYGWSNRVDHCYFAGKTHVGATLVVWVGDRPNWHRIDRNHFGPRPPLGTNGGETIRVGDSRTSMNSSRTVVEENLFERCDGEIEIVSNKSCDNVYRGNTFWECAGTLTLRHGNRCLVLENVFIGNGKKNTGGIRILGEDHRIVGNRFYELAGTGLRAALCLMNGIPDSPLNGYFQVKRAVVASNTLARCAQDIVIGFREGKATLAPVDCVITDNCVLTCDLKPVTLPVVGPGWRAVWR